ncbi:MAG: PaaI family thioesterase [Pseudomonadota bacterium]
MDAIEFGLPGLLGIVSHGQGEGWCALSLRLAETHRAANGYLHAGTLVTLADTACGFGCVASMPEGGAGFTTIELKSNFLGSARDGVIRCRAEADHLGRTTQVWSATVVHEETGKSLALFRCTQLILRP